MTAHIALNSYEMGLSSKKPMQTLAISSKFVVQFSAYSEPLFIGLPMHIIHHLSIATYTCAQSGSHCILSHSELCDALIVYRILLFTPCVPGDTPTFRKLNSLSIVFYSSHFKHMQRSDM